MDVDMIKEWFRSGSPWIWLNAAAVSTCFDSGDWIVGLIMARGIGHFWLSPIVQISYVEDGQAKTIIGESKQLCDVSSHCKISGF
jgi:phosphate transport system permease protein